MKTIKVIDLLNMIANGEKVPNVIKIEDVVLERFEYSKGDGSYGYSYQDKGHEIFLSDYSYPQYLNDEIEIIEENTSERSRTPKKIEKLETYKYEDGYEYFKNILKVSKNGEYEITEDMSVVVDKINEIIDKINEMENN